MARAKHLHVRREQQASSFTDKVDRMSIEAERLTALLKKNKKFEHWYSVDPVGFGPGKLYPTLKIVYHRVRRER